MAQAVGGWGEADFARLFAVMSVAMLVTDVEGRFVAVNDAGCDLLGRPAEDLIGRSVTDVVHPDEQAQALDMRQRLRAGEPGAQRYVRRFLRPDGTDVWAESYVRTIFDDEGRPEHFCAVMLDVTARRGAEVANEHLASIVGASVDAIISSDLDGMITSWNPGAERMFGYSAEEIVGSDGMVLWPEPDPARWRAGVEIVRAGGFVDIPEAVRLRKDGSEVRVSLVGCGVHDARGDLIGVAVIMRDLTEHRQAAIVASSSDAILSIDLDGRITSWNAGARLLFGYTDQEAIGQGLDLIVAPDRRSQVVDVLDQVRGGLPLEPFETQRVHKDGHVLTVSLAVAPVLDRDGQVVGASASARDVTEARAAQEALWESNAMKEAVLDASLDAVVTMDPEGRILDFNPAAELIFDYAAAEAIGRNVGDLLIPSELRDQFVRGLQRYRETGLAPVLGQRFETRAQRRGGEEVPIELAVHSVEVDGTARFAAFIRDLTEAHRLAEQQRTLEHRLHQAQRLESLGQLAGGIAHDFNNLLSVILSYSGFISEATEDPVVRDDVGEIQAAAERAAALIRQLLIFSRRDSVRTSLVAVDQIVEGLRTMLRRSIGEHIEIRIEQDPDLPPIEADAGQIEQVVLNLVLNARDAMPDGGTLIVRTTTCSIDDGYVERRPGARAGEFVELSVSDTGIGMDAEVASHIFEPFFTTKGPGEGTGLGLATAHGIVTDAGGFIEVYSEVGLGTVFRVRLPVAHGQVGGATAPEASAVPTGSGETVLLVEDEDALRRGTARMLERSGYRVLQAAGGTEALAIARDEAIDLLLTDVVMPGMSGRQVAQAVSGLRPSAAIVYMSGFSQGSVGAMFEPIDELDLIQKPFTERVLLEHLAAALERHRRG